MERKGISPQSMPQGRMVEESITTNFGHDGVRVVLQFTKPVPNMILTVEKAEEWCRNIQGVIEAIKAAQLKQLGATPGGPDAHAQLAGNPSGG